MTDDFSGKVMTMRERDCDSGCHQNSHFSPSRIVLGVCVANGTRLENVVLVRSACSVLLFILRRLKRSSISEILPCLTFEVRAKRRSRVELNSVRKAPKSPRGVARTKNGPCSNP